MFNFCPMFTKAKKLFINTKISKISRSWIFILKLHYYYYVLLFLVGHRAATRFLQRSRSFATTFSFFPISLEFFISISSDLFHDIFGLPRCLLPWGFHSNDSRQGSENGFLSVWPIQLFTPSHFSRSSLLEIDLGHQKFITRLKHLLTKTCI